MLMIRVNEYKTTTGKLAHSDNEKEDKEQSVRSQEHVMYKEEYVNLIYYVHSFRSNEQQSSLLPLCTYIEHSSLINMKYPDICMRSRQRVVWVLYTKNLKLHPMRANLPAYLCSSQQERKENFLRTVEGKEASDRQVLNHKRFAVCFVFSFILHSIVLSRDLVVESIFVK